MIESKNNQQVKNLTGLLKRSKERKQQQVYVVEGRKMFEEAPLSQLVKAYVSESFFNGLEDKSRLEQMEYEILRDDVYMHASDTQSPQGVMLVVKQPEYQPEDMMGEDGLIIFIENLQDPGNLGTIVRAAEGAGVTGIIMSEGTVDIFNPKTIRSTMGSIYRVPFCYVADIKEAIAQAQRKGVQVYAAHLKGEKSYDMMDYKRATGFVIGNEGKGLTDDTANCADTFVKIPMMGQVESLNAAVATSVLMYEAARQRR